LPSYQVQSSYFFFLIGLQGLDGPLTPTGLLPNYDPEAADRLGKSAACSKVFFLIDKSSAESCPVFAAACFKWGEE
jgi:hypothetical protein